ncbi:hypothetical protein [Nonomuraea rubra]|uniref:Uncharacterized protein n=1 Tax=Nonomuraea rubra TaxID=46180 RepID=A0A7X0P6N7_9ACTN|nr:hypothetical protein [Nonomuraea rubra]MBB6556254.1 hypothetical protein [Nonomuraea rubra]
MTKVLETLAAYAHEYGLDNGGGHLRTALLAACLTERQPEIPAAEVIALAAGDPWDPRVREASQEKDRLLDAASLAALLAEQGEQDSEVAS